MLKFQLESGKMVEFNLGTIEQGLNLYRALIHECKNAGLDITIQQEDTVLDVVMKNKEALLNIMGSSYVLDAVKDCCDKVIYDKQRFSMEVFEEEGARQDFFPLMTLVGVENLRPFFPQAHTLFSIILYPVLKA